MNVQKGRFKRLHVVDSLTGKILHIAILLRYTRNYAVNIFLIARQKHNLKQKPEFEFASSNKKTENLIKTSLWCLYHSIDIFFLVLSDLM